MSSKRPVATKLIRMQARTRAFRGAGKVATVACCMSLGFVVLAAALPQKRELDQLEVKLKQAIQHEQQVVFERDCRQIELRALREDPEFLELHARDRLNYCRPGERVLHFKRDPR